MSLLSSGKVFCTLLLSSIFWKALYTLLLSAIFWKGSLHSASIFNLLKGFLRSAVFYIPLNVPAYFYFWKFYTEKSLSHCRTVSLKEWEIFLKKITGKYRELPEFTGHYHKLPENRNEKIFFCRIVALIFNKWIPELWDIKCNTDSYFLPLAEPKCIFLCKIKKP